jgi:diphosphomevalonate decarboxylase
MQATAKAHTNIALIKYWGKRDESLILPMNGSVSMTLDEFYTTTTVSFHKRLTCDRFVLNGKLQDASEQNKVASFLNHVRALGKSGLYAEVTSENHVPTSAGLASSASGFAALAAAAAKAIGLDLTGPELSRLARRGSGSACRSIFGGFVEWQKGELADGMDSYGIPLVPQDYWDLRILVTILAREPKNISSRDGMRRTVKTSPFYAGWLETVAGDLALAKDAILKRDFETLGRVAEANALKMHATTLAANPPFTYWQNDTLSVMQKVSGMREIGLPAYFTIDAGPNIKVLCESQNVSQVREILLTVPGVQDVIACHPGPSVAYLQEVTA